MELCRIQGFMCPHPQKSLFLPCLGLAGAGCRPGSSSSAGFLLHRLKIQPTHLLTGLLLSPFEASAAGHTFPVSPAKVSQELAVSQYFWVIWGFIYTPHCFDQAKQSVVSGGSCGVVYKGTNCVIAVVAIPLINALMVGLFVAVTVCFWWPSHKF